jgi:hypothetical protein
MGLPYLYGVERAFDCAFFMFFFDFPFRFVMLFWEVRAGGVFRDGELKVFRGIMVYGWLYCSCCLQDGSPL